MSPAIGPTGVDPIPCSMHGPFFRDPFFKESWQIISKQKKEYEIKHQIEPDKYSLEKDLPFRSNIIQSPVVKESGNKFSNLINGHGKVEEEPMVVEAGTASYQVILDIQHFRPDEVSVVKVPSESKVIVEGKHEEKYDPTQHGFISRQFTRKYSIPTDVDLGGIVANMSSDGILQIVLPRTAEAIEAAEAKAAAADAAGTGQTGVDQGFLAKMKSYLIEPIVHALPDFHMVPFWHRFFESAAKPGIQSDRSYFKVLVDVKEFSPEELSIECTEYFITIEGSHEEKRDSHGSIARRFTRTFDLPKCIVAKDVECTLLVGGILEIKAPKFIVNVDEGESRISIPVVVSEEAAKEREEEEKRKANQDLDILNWISLQ